MIEKGADTLSIHSYGNNYQRMKITRSREKEEVLEIRIKKIKEEFLKKLDEL